MPRDRVGRDAEPRYFRQSLEERYRPPYFPRSRHGLMPPRAPIRSGDLMASASLARDSWDISGCLVFTEEFLWWARYAFYLPWDSSRVWAHRHERCAAPLSDRKYPPPSIQHWRYRCGISWDIHESSYALRHYVTIRRRRGRVDHR